ncbi:MAG: cytidylate kinase-like family protein [Verrucomicrobiae bacterium]|nr:cytidylate kinase-like family protein [Verrucomicrobiae bacterium]
MNTRVSFDACKSYINCQLQRGETQTQPQASSPVVTISRQAGAGGVPLAEKLVNFLRQFDQREGCPWTMFDKRLVEKVLEDHHLSQRIARFMPEDRYSSIQDTIESLLGLHPHREALVENTSRTILNLARMGNVIIVGRGANVVIGFAPNALHVRLIGSLENRVRHIQEYYQMSRAEALDYVKRADEGRKRYLRHNFNKDIDDPMLYHVVLNTDHVGIEEAVSLIGRMVLDKARTLASQAAVAASPAPGT